MLIRLDNGTWIDPASVTAVQPNPSGYADGTLLVWRGSNPAFTFSLSYYDNEKASEAADNLARHINDQLVAAKPDAVVLTNNVLVLQSSIDY
jgi:hypothetical protein